MSNGLRQEEILQRQSEFTFAPQGIDSASSVILPERVAQYPELRYMGSKRRLLPWIYQHLDKLDFESAADPFVGSGCVAYMLKCMGRRVVASDFLNFPVTLAAATIVNNNRRIDEQTAKNLLVSADNTPNFIEKTFSGIFYTPEDLKVLDRLSNNIDKLSDENMRALARAAVIRACLKKQPRGVFTFAGARYDDGRRDLHVSIEQHFLEQVEVFNNVVFSNGRRHSAKQSDVFELSGRNVDLVYLDPPYVPRADDNCYVKRYHFLEGISCYWRGLEVMENSKVKKIPKRFTPFSYRKTAIEAIDKLFNKFSKSTIVLSYSSNAYPDRDELERLLRKYKRHVDVFEKPHRYHFGNHVNVERAEVNEYLLIGR
jgi:DNA adenine methylase/adenine-specific DNA-methyltransferase